MSWVEDYFTAWARHAQASDPVNGLADRERMLSFMHSDIFYEDVPTAMTFKGHDGVVEMGRMARVMANEMRFVCISAQHSGDRFGFETETYGTNTGPVGDLPATNKPFKLRGVSIGKLAPDGKVIEHKDYWDLAFYLRQIGLTPNG